MSGSRLRPYLGPLVALLVVLVVGAGTVYAAIPNSNGRYYACRVSNTGVVKLINYPKVSTCPAGEKLISWNAKGPQGPAGPQGPVGPVGPAGPAGASGSSNWADIVNTPADLADGQIGWGEIVNKPAGFADGQVAWDKVTGKPAGFADGVDSGAFVSQTCGPYQLPDGIATWPVKLGPFSPNVDVDLSVIPTVGTVLRVDDVLISRSGSDLYYEVWVHRMPEDPAAFKIRARTYSEGISPAGLKQQLKNVRVTLKTVKRSK